MWLTVVTGTDSGARVRVVGPRFVVGRDDYCDLLLRDEKVSRNHAYLEVLPHGEVRIHDLGSTNGTFVNGRRLVGPALVEPGAQLRFGDTLVSAELEEARVSTTPLGRAEWSAPGPPPTTGTMERAVLRRSVRRATLLAGVAVGVAVAVVALFLTGVLPPGGTPSVPEIVDAVRPSTVLVLALQKGQPFASGTGWVYDAGKGLVVTNAHVVNDGTTFAVGVGGKQLPATIVGVAPCEDLAVLKVDGASGLKTLPLGSQADLKLGATVVALGYAANASLQDELTTTVGVVSVVREEFRLPSIDVPRYPNVIQTDAAINPGNSGGPLVDQHERLVGVNSAGITLLGGRTIQGQGYAIGVDQIKQVVPFLAGGHSTGWTGMGFEYPTSSADLTDLGLPGAAPGLIVTHVVAGTAAERAGFGSAPMLVTAVNGKTVDNTLASYCDAVAGVEQGATATFTVVSADSATPRQVEVNFQ